MVPGAGRCPGPIAVVAGAERPGAASRRPGLPRPWRRLGGDGHGGPFAQRLHRLRAQPLASVEDRRLRRRVVAFRPPRGPRQPIRQLTERVLIRPSECIAIPIANAPSPAPATTDFASQYGSLLGSPHRPAQARTPASAHRPIPTSDRRRSETGFFHPARGIPANYSAVDIAERYWG